MKLFKQFLKSYRSKTFSKGEIILFEGEEPTCAYVVKRGIVKTYNITADGQEKPISFDSENEMFPLGWVFYKLKLSQYYYEAFTDCELYCVPRDDFLTQIRKDNDLLFTLFEDYVKHLLNIQMRLNALEQSKAADKVLHMMHFLALRFGREIREHVVQVRLPLTQQDLANFMGLTRETTGIELKKLEKAGVVRYSRQTYIIHTNKLNERLDEDYDQGRLQDGAEQIVRGRGS